MSPRRGENRNYLKPPPRFNLPSRLKTAFVFFKLWCKECGQSPAIHSFQRVCWTTRTKERLLGRMWKDQTTLFFRNNSCSLSNLHSKLNPDIRNWRALWLKPWKRQKRFWTFWKTEYMPNESSTAWQSCLQVSRCLLVYLRASTYQPMLWSRSCMRDHINSWLEAAFQTKARKCSILWHFRAGLASP